MFSFSTKRAKKFNYSLTSKITSSNYLKIRGSSRNSTLFYSMSDILTPMAHVPVRKNFLDIFRYQVLAKV